MKKYFKFKIFIFLFLTITFRVVFANDLSVNISFNTNKEKQEEYREIVEKIKQKLSIYKYSTNNEEVNTNRVKLLHNYAIKEIREVLIANGLDKPIINAKISFSQPTFIAKYIIEPGPETIIKNIEIKINKLDFSNQLGAIVEKPRIKLNQRLSHENYEDTKDDLLDSFIRIGFLNAKLTKHELFVDKETNSAKIILHLQKGKKYRFGTVKFESEKYSNSILSRYIPFIEGEFYNTKTLEKFKKNLFESGLFSKIKIYSEADIEDPKNNVVPIRVRVKEKPNNRYHGSIGYGTNTGERASIGWTRRHIGNRGIEFSANAFLSRINKSIKTSFDIPGINPVYDNYFVAGNFIEEKVKKRLSRKEEVLLEKINQSNNVKRNFGLKYTHELYKETPTADKKHSSFLLPYFRYNWIKEYPYARQFDFSGKRIDFFIQASPGKLISSTDIIQMEIGGKFINKLGENLRLLINTKVGTTISSDFDRIPLSMRYFVGGDNSIRGFSYKSIGPTETDDNGEVVVVGGKHHFIANTEIDYLFKESFSVAAFVDAGNAMNRLNESIAIGTGFGFRYHSPIGTLKVDLAQPIARKQDNKNLRIHLTFGKEL